MPLERSCEEYKNKLVLVWPTIGFGWCRIDPNASANQPGGAIEPPPSFHAKIREFHDFNGEIAAGIGVVEEQDHPFDKEWVAFCIRDRGKDMYNLTTNPGNYNVSIGKNKPTITIDLDVAMPQWMRFEGPPIVSGLGFIAESEVRIKEKYKWLK